MVERILEKAKKRVDSAEVFRTETEITEISFEAGVLKNAERKSLSGAALRVVHEGRLGFSSTTDPDRIDDMIEHARSGARFGKEAAFYFPGAVEPAGKAPYDPAIEAYSPQQAVEEGERAVEALRETCPNGLSYVTITTAVSKVRIANTAGLDVSYKTTAFSHSVVLNIVEGDSILWIEDGGEFGTLTLKTDEYVAGIADLSKKSERKAPKVSGDVPVVFTSRQLPNLLQAIEFGVDGLRMVKGESPLIGREGDRVLGSVTLTDDPFIMGAPGSRPFDDEGVPSQRNMLFDNGVFRSFLFDLDTAAAAGRTTTSSAHRSSLSSPSIGTSNLVINAGDSSFDDMISGIDRGIVVYGVIGGGQSNLIAGDFAVNVMLGFLVDRGEIAGRLLDTMVSGNVYDAFGDVSLMSAKLTQTGTLFAPDILFPSLSVSSGSP